MLLIEEFYTAKLPIINTSGIGIFLNTEENDTLRGCRCAYLFSSALSIPWAKPSPRLRTARIDGRIEPPHQCIDLPPDIFDDSRALVLRYYSLERMLHHLFSIQSDDDGGNGVHYNSYTQYTHIYNTAIPGGYRKAGIKINQDHKMPTKLPQKQEPLRHHSCVAERLACGKSLAG